MECIFLGRLDQNPAEHFTLKDRHDKKYILSPVGNLEKISSSKYFHCIDCRLMRNRQLIYCLQYLLSRINNFQFVYTKLRVSLETR